MKPLCITLLCTCVQTILAASSSRVINGPITTIDQYPWTAAIDITKPTGAVFCGGALIKEQWVVTSASCVASATAIVVRLGSTTRTTAPAASTFTIPLANVYPHFAFNSTLLHNNIALIKLPSAVAVSTTVQVVPLLPVDQSCAGTIRYFILSGWGANAMAATSTLSNDLRFTKVTEVTNAACITLYGVTKILPTTLCGNVVTGTPAKMTPCKGDEGSPLILINTINYLVGILSSLPPTACGSTQPNTYTLVAPYKDWMNTFGVAL